MTNKVIFKYRSLEPWEYLLDILLNQRLFSASFQSLNDPMEGVFTYTQDKTKPSFIEQMVSHKAELKICSLSKTYNNTVMWSYYAAAHKGVVLGVEVNSDATDVIVIENVSYSKDNVFRGFLGSDAATEVRKVLSKKLTAWKHEKEVRVFSRSSYVPITLRSMHLGCQMPKEQKVLLGKLLRRINPAVEIHEMRRDDLDSSLYENI